MELEPEGRAARGLRNYLRMVVAALGLDEAGHYLTLDRPVTAYLPVDTRLPRFPDHDVALVWDEEHGWAIGIETDAGSPVTPLCYLGIDILPAPQTVADFVRDVVEDRFPGQPDPPRLRTVTERLDRLSERLATYTPPLRPFSPRRPAGLA